ncbi:GmrSD restriction endonuclease domain-containing protein [Mesorhizobium sp. Cs1299R1N3]|uniref:GmrSD restriction endonuclease domain-containing protein n=1 Tax=Mesorhizobium sp. Cs1299R1N3 TaxID=3015173 RepID=UPI00301D942E
MGAIRIVELGIAEVLENLRKGTWQVPKFQREFVWDTSAVAELATSIIDAYPIGMATLWQQSHLNPLDLERVSIADYDVVNKKHSIAYFGKDTGDPNLLAILDGRQRCTAIAMAFAGFAPSFGRSKYCGSYFLNASQPDPLERVIFIKRSDLQRRGLTSTSSCIGQGLFPLASDQSDESVMRQWYRYAQEIKNPANYPHGQLPEPGELARRDAIVQAAFDGITSTKLAACIVPEDYDLGKICEIFETLNLSGMKVSTVDLINAWVYRETEHLGDEAIQIREWMKELGDLDGAAGWAVPEKRPELIAQMVTACFVAADDLADKPKPRVFSGTRKVGKITSVKSPDLLATPYQHWQNVVRNDAKFALFIGEFQTCVAGGMFPYDSAPYPISGAIYVALRWHKEFDPPASHSGWSVENLHSLFRGFYWRNALSRRYDQGFLTTLGSDLSFLKALLNRRTSFPSTSKWLEHCEARISEDLIEKDDLPTKEDLVELLTNGKPGGAIQAALQLPMVAGTKRDVDGIDISYKTEKTAELHHIFPRKWCADNAFGQLKEYLDREQAARDWVNGICNLMPLSRETNNKWKSQYPAQYLGDSGISYSSAKAYFDSVFIGPEEFTLLTGGPENIPYFWRSRANKMAEKLVSLMTFTI